MMKKNKFIFASIFLGSALTNSCIAQTDLIEPRSRGAVVPKDLSTVVMAQKLAGISVAALLDKSVAPPPPGVGAGGIMCSADQSKFNWQDFDKVTPAQNQNKCGSCWTFAAVAAFESSFLIENKTSFPQSKVGASEQQGLDCASPTYNCNGGWHDKVFDYFIKPSESNRSEYAYVGEKKQCIDMRSRPYTAVQWNFVEGANLPPKEKLKAAICSHGPIVAAVNSDGWDAIETDPATGRQYYVYSKENPKWGQTFKDGVYKDSKPSKPHLDINNLEANDIDHDVLIVGWDDTAGGSGAWIVKNSWGTRWGNDGFIKVAYGTANLGFNAAWIQAAKVLPNVPREIPERLQNAIQIINKNAIEIHALELTR